MDDLVDVDVEDISQYDLYKDGLQNGETFSNMKEEQEINQKYGAST